MILIDINQTVSLTFSGNWYEKTGTTELKLTDKTKNVTNTYPLTYILSHSTRYTEYAIESVSGYTGFVDQLEAGQYHYEFIVDGYVKDKGECKIIGTSLNIPIYKDDMSEYQVYRN